MCFTFFFQSYFAPFFFLNFPLASFLQLLQLYSFYAMVLLLFCFYICPDFAHVFAPILLMCLLQLCLCVYFDFIHAFLPHVHFCVTPSTLLLHLFQLNLLLFLFFGFIPTSIFQLCSCICSYITSPTSNLCMFQLHSCVCSNFVLTCLLPCHHYVQVLSNLLLLNSYLA
jgi:hypothetical protein